MDPRLLRYYERELRHVREMGGEFAREFPKIAGRLGLDAFECSDPYVERLLESFAFLAARVQLKVDAEFPTFTQHMLELLYPGYLAPTPSMAVVQLRPNLREGSLRDGFVVKRGTSLRSELGKHQTACEYRTAHDVTLWPLELIGADYSTSVAEFVDVERTGVRQVKAALRLVLRATGGHSFEQLGLRTLPIFLRGADDTAARLFEQCLSASSGMVVQTPGRPATVHQVWRGKTLAARGFGDDEALLPTGERAFNGQRLLHEYFAFPQRFMFVDVQNLDAALKGAREDKVELVLLFGRSDPRLEGVVKASQLALFSTPAINLFQRSADRVHLSDRDHEYLVTPDRTRPLDLEVYAVTSVMGHGSRGSDAREFVPLYSADARGAGTEPGHYTVRRQPRMLSARERRSGPRSSYVGSETFITLVDGTHGPFGPELRQLAISTLCTNRDLPMHLAVGQRDSDFSAQSGAPIEAVRCVAGPTPPRPSPVHGALAWRLLSHLSLDYTSLARGSMEQNASAVRELLMLYADVSDPATVKQVQGVIGVAANRVVRPLPLPGPITFGRGTEVVLACDETAFEGGSLFLLGAVLERFFAKYASINAFTETVLRSVQRGEIMRWPAMPGRRQTL
jgi:type VI secretion system protein ImpG